MNIPKLLTANEVAEELRLHPATFRRLVRENRAPPHTLVGHKRLFPVDQLARWLDAQSSGRGVVA